MIGVSMLKWSLFVCRTEWRHWGCYTIAKNSDSVRYPEGYSHQIAKNEWPEHVHAWSEHNVAQCTKYCY